MLYRLSDTLEAYMVFLKQILRMVCAWGGFFYYNHRSFYNSVPTFIRVFLYPFISIRDTVSCICENMENGLFVKKVIGVGYLPALSTTLLLM